MASPTARELLAADPDVRYVWRHLPLADVHPHARLAAEAAEAAGAQGRFWDMHEMLLANQTHLDPGDIVGYAGRLDLDVERFRADLAAHAFAGRVARDVESADLSGVSGTPTFFINDQRHRGPQDLATLTTAIAAMRASPAGAAPPAHTRPGPAPGRGGAAMSDAPTGARYSADHLWVLPRDGGGVVRVGLTGFAQESLGDVMAVTAPQPGSRIAAGVTCGEVESTKSVSDLVAPLSGTVTDRNQALDDDPAAVNDDPYGRGWLFEVEVDPSTLSDQLAGLMSAPDYERLAAG